MSLSKRKRNQGYAIVEFGAACAFLVPLVGILSYTGWQASNYIFINNALNDAARAAARGCAMAYGTSPGGALASPDSQGYNVAPPQISAVYTPPTTTIVQGSSSSSGSPPATPNQVFSYIRMAGVVTDNSQFVASYTPPAPNNQDPSYALGRVSVTVSYTGTFPNPDPLGLGNSLLKVKPQASCSYPLEY